MSDTFDGRFEVVNLPLAAARAAAVSRALRTGGLPTIGSNAPVLSDGVYVRRATNHAANVIVSLPRGQRDREAELRARATGILVAAGYLVEQRTASSGPRAGRVSLWVMREDW